MSDNQKFIDHPAEGPVPDAALMKERKRRNRLNISNWIALFVLGIINNFSYVVVNSFSSDIAEYFDASDYLGFITWFNAGFGFFFRIAHSAFMLSIPVHARMIINTVIYFIGLLGTALSTKVNFVFALVCIIFVGASSTLGESILVGYLSRFPAKSVGGWSSGTGGAGVLGAGIVLVFEALDWDLMTDFLILLPLVAIYYLTFALWLRRPSEDDLKAMNEEDSQQKPQKQPETETEAVPNPSINTAQEEGGVPPEQLPSENEQLTTDQTPLLTTPEPQEGRIHKIWRVFTIVSSPAIQLMLVYLFEYLVTSGCAELAVPEDWQDDSDNYFVENSYSVISFCYQIGVFLSRSSLALFKIRRIWILTLIQFINLVLWLFQDGYHFIKVDYIWFLFAHAIFVGLLGGAMYVNVFYIILQMHLSQKDRELATNITLVFVTIGTTLSSVGSLILQNFIFTDDDDD